MTALGISIGWSAREDIDRVVDLVKRAADDGVDACWVIDSQVAMRDAFALLAVLSRETERIKLGPGVTNLLTRHETVVATTLATLSALAPGRILAGIGAGDSAVFPIGLEPQKIVEMRSGVERVRTLLRGGEVDYLGTTVGITAASTPPPPIYLAASQPKMLAMAGAVADGVIVMGPSHPETYRTQIDHVRRGAAASGRDPDSVAIDLWVTMAVGEGAIDAVRSWASAQARWLDRWESIPAAFLPFRDEIRRSATAYNFSDHLSVAAEHAGVVSDEFAIQLAVAGDTEQCRDRMRSIAAIGVDRITVSLMSGGRQRRLDDLVGVWEGVTG